MEAMDGMDRADFEEKARWLEEIRAVEAAEQAIAEKKSESGVEAQSCR